MRETKKQAEIAHSDVEKLLSLTSVKSCNFIYLRPMNSILPVFSRVLRGIKDSVKPGYAVMIAMVGFIILTSSNTISSKAYLDGQYVVEDTIAELHLSSIIQNFDIDIEPEIAYKDHAIRGGLVYDVTRNKIVWGKEMDKAVPIASLSKMMVALITVEEISKDSLSWDTEVEVTREAARVTGSKVYLKQGEKLSIKKLMEAAMIRSGNDACYLLAQFVSGTEKDFVVRMNEKAKELGMENTKFSNSTGLPTRGWSTDNSSTPLDLLMLAKEMLKYPELVDITSRQQETIDNGYNSSFTFNNRNKLVKAYEEDIDGLKTGFTNNARYCIVATSKRCDYRVISIVLGVESSYLRNQIVVGMMSNYYERIGLGVLGEEIEDNTVADIPPELPIYIEETEIEIDN